jgi:hypothetical protein
MVRVVGIAAPPLWFLYGFDIRLDQIADQAMADGVAGKRRLPARVGLQE